MSACNLEGRVAWVTGGAHGIGSAIADELRERGATVVVSDREPSGEVLACDMRNPEAIACCAAGIASRHGSLDILVNNAAVQRRRHFVDFTEADFDEVFETNVRGVFLASQACARVMVRSGRGGSIVQISSVNATHAQPETALYCASKGAVATMTRALAVALGPHGIRVNAVAPGTIVTGINRDRLSSESTVAQVVSNTALGRLGMPDDVAPAVAFLASDDAAFITGASLAIHGGWTLSG